MSSPRVIQIRHKAGQRIQEAWGTTGLEMSRPRDGAGGCGCCRTRVAKVARPALSARRGPILLNRRMRLRPEASAAQARNSGGLGAGS